MKVLHLLPTDRFSGAENVVCQIIGMMKGHPEYEMVYCSADGQIRRALRERGITFAPVKKLSVREARRVLKEQKPDLIHAHDMRASFIAALVCGKIPLVSHIHNNNVDARKLTLKAILYRIAAAKASHIFWVSQSALEGYAFHGSLVEKSSILTNVLDLDALREKLALDKNSYDYDIVYVGRLTYQKNPERLIRVLSRIIRTRPRIKAALVGTGELASEAERLITAEGMEGRIELLGFRSNPLKLMRDAKVMLMTSRWEGTPMCALEAMALGLPIVSTPVDGLKDLVFNGKNGFLSEDDAVLADKVTEIVENGELRAKLSENSKKQAAERNDLSKYKKRLLAVYRGEGGGVYEGICDHPGI